MDVDNRVNLLIDLEMYYALLDQYTGYLHSERTMMQYMKGELDEYKDHNEFHRKLGFQNYRYW